MDDKKEIMIAMDPQMAAKFSASTHVSLTKGVSANMLKVSASFVVVETNIDCLLDLEQETEDAEADQGREGSCCSEGS